MRLTRTTTLLMAAALVAAATGRLPAQAADIPGAIIPTADDPPTRQGTRGANFLEIGIGARGNAMAGAIASFTNGPSAWYWNAAGAAAAENFQFHATRQNLYGDLDIAQNYFAASIPFLGGVVGASFNTLNSGEMTRTTTSAPFGGNVLGETFEWNSTAVGLGYARRLTDRLDLGGQLKYITEGLPDAEISWVAVDLGTQFRTGIYGLVVGATIQNIGPSSKMEGTLLRRRVNDEDEFNQSLRVGFASRETELPTLFRFSVGSDLYGTVGSIFGQGDGRNRLLGVLEFSDAIDTDLQTALGVEYGWNNIVFARAGKRWYNDDRDIGSDGIYGLSGGLGVRFPIAGRAISFDYSYTTLGDALENTQVFSFEFGQ